MKGKELPDGWVWKRLGECCEIIRGISFPTNSKIDCYQEGYAGCFRTANVQEDVDLDDVWFIPETYVRNEQQYVRVSDILISTANSLNLVGKVAFVKKLNHKTTLGAFISLLRSRGGIDPKYLYYYLSSNEFKHFIPTIASTTTNISNITVKKLEKFQMLIPQLSIQRQIVAVLEQAEALKRQRHEADALTGALLQSVFYEMFGDPVRNEKRWPLKKMGDLGIWTSGGTPSRAKPKYFEGNIPWYSAGELNDSYLTDSIEHISKEGLDTSAAKMFSPGTMLIGMYDSAAFKMGILQYPSASNQACAAFSPNLKTIDPLFALQLFKAMKSEFLLKRRGVRQKNLTQQMIKDFEVPLPPLALQQQFARIVEDVERVRERQAESGKEIEALCGVLMQRAFRGELVA